MLLSVNNYMSNASLKEVAQNMLQRDPDKNLEHYAVTIIANKEGNPSWSVQSIWDGFADDEHKIEIRKASLVNASRLVKFLREEAQEGCMVAEKREELSIFLLMGGHAVIEKNIAEAVLEEFLKPHPVARTGFTGFQSTKDIPDTTFQRSPTKKQRIRVLKRDGYRCKICGRAPHNNVDITLHVHHIRPWADKGLTHGENLLTLCHTCHEGLDPHHELFLFGLLTESGQVFDTESSRKDHFEAVKLFRKESFKRAKEVST